MFNPHTGAAVEICLGAITKEFTKTYSRPSWIRVRILPFSFSENTGTANKEMCLAKSGLASWRNAS